MEQQLCGGETVIVVGGGDAAGQAAVFLSRTTAQDPILVRGDSLAAPMADCLVQRIEQSPRTTLHPHTEITALDEDERLHRMSWTTGRTASPKPRRWALSSRACACSSRPTPQGGAAIIASAHEYRA